ncbi:hypothetical protein WR25_17681 [Diploscapter pachys]|uniref:Uncharacterized protein n=1 Tax=Diploscapter pachys TaxID=2018661 RepID=A0A2A2KS12_9BILA|nr:hypothetical protein WR25_17681 [Diploscapter pachys]
MSSEIKGAEKKVDIVELWRASESLPVQGRNKEDVALTRSSITERFQGERSDVWKNFGFITPKAQGIIIRKVINDWPYWKERYAMTLPFHFTAASTCISSVLIATRINSDMIGFNPKMGLIESCRTLPKSPWITSCYVSGITYVLLYTALVQPQIESELHPCASCVLGQNIAAAMIGGALLPAVCTPYMCGFLMMQETKKFPEPRNLLEMVTMCWEGSKIARTRMALVLPLQVAVAAASTYTLLWGRDRFYKTMDADPDLARELIHKSMNTVTFGERIRNYLKKIPAISGEIHTPPEKEDVKNFR